MARIPGTYPQTSMQTVKALMAYHDLTVASGHATPDHRLLLEGLPQGSITKARLVGEGPHAGLIAFTIKDRNERYIEPEGFFMVKVLVLFEAGSLFIDKNSADETERKDYPEVFGNLGITVLRLLADAQRGELVRLAGDHHDLSASRLVVAAGRRNIERGRREALAEALKAYDQNAKGWGLANHLSRWEYQTMLRNAFRLYDIRHGHQYVRQLGVC